LNLEDRGALIPGSFADIVIFDIDRIKMTGTFLNPAQRPEGIEYVFVNGKIVYKDMSHTGEMPGKLLRHKY
jgi:N-acyl-D-amino-acid deacylase